MNDEDTPTPDLDSILQPYKDAIVTLAKELEDLRGQVGSLNDLLVNQVIGGIKNLHDSSVREEGINALKTKYGDTIKPLESALPDLGINDWAGELHSHLQDMAAKTPGWNDEMEANHVGGIMQALQDKVGRIAQVAGGKPVAASVEVTKDEPAPEAEATPEAPDDDEDSEPDPSELIKSFKNLKERSKGSSHRMV